MGTEQESTLHGRWSGLLLSGAAAGLGAPLMLSGLRRLLQVKPERSRARVGLRVGALAALVAGGLARRWRHAHAAHGTHPADGGPLGLEQDGGAAHWTEHAADGTPLGMKPGVDGGATRCLEHARDGTALWRRHVAHGTASTPEPDLSQEALEEAELTADRRREARRRRLAALGQHAAAHVEAPSPDAALRALERRHRRGPSGREQPWHEASLTPG
ncbi:hypothetical protein JY651_47050 [Pyxidicoccus parkwayensis]|uniref:Uncharacterized protein n=1 Tax=Pyxidicoccus parkwayensis TaxID=2813578 RepID=A0ABX7NVU4_9BACT|nr:hypothetical protein [Pyxidicoccus parkwaysis]QSQ22588.1 hypothetical protein JY651_47050 [Pyxidicoccus parkwaysis]